MLKSRAVKLGFTLVELAAVVCVLGILASIVLVRTGSLRNAAIDTKLAASALEFSKCIEALRSQGIDPKASLLSDTNSYLMLGQFLGDPTYMGMTTSVYRVSSPANVNVAAINTLLTRLNALLSVHDVGFNRITGAFGSNELCHVNADLISVLGGGLYLRFTR